MDLQARKEIAFLSLDLSTKPGWALWNKGKLINYGTIFPDGKIGEFGKYPINYIRFAEYIVEQIHFILCDLVATHYFPIKCLIIEETTGSSQNYSQKIIEFIHFAVIKDFDNLDKLYIRDGIWKRLTGSTQNKDEKKHNAKIARLKKKDKAAGGDGKVIKIDGKRVGKLTRKHYVIRAVKEQFGIDFKLKDNDAADAIMIGKGFLLGAPLCNGRIDGGLLKKNEPKIK